MLKYLVSLLCVVVLAASCLKDRETGCPYLPNNTTAPETEVAALKTYLDTNDIVAVKHPSGFYYQVVNAGTGTDSATLCSQIQITYTGTLTNGSQFDKQSNVVFTVGALIEGWRKGIPLIKKGGDLKLYIPPSLGYGSVDQKNQQGQVLIPANSILIFDIKLVDLAVGN